MKGKKDREITDDDEERKKRMRKPVDERKDQTKDKKENDRRKWRTGLDWMPLKPKRTQTEACRQWAEPTSPPADGSITVGSSSNTHPPPLGPTFCFLETFRADFKSFKEPSDLKKKFKKKKIEKAVRATSTF